MFNHRKEKLKLAGICVDLIGLFYSASHNVDYRYIDPSLAYF